MKHRASSPPVYQDSLFDPARTVERTLSNGTCVRVKLEPLGQGRVKILVYQRRPLGGMWQRCQEEEGRVLEYRQLKLQASYEEIFSQ
jgi:hypothetical protein